MAAVRKFPGLLALLLMAGCGLKGPLYLPDQPQEAVAPSARETQRKRATPPLPSPQSQKEDEAQKKTTPAVSPPDPKRAFTASTNDSTQRR